MSTIDRRKRRTPAWQSDVTYRRWRRALAWRSAACGGWPVCRLWSRPRPTWPPQGQTLFATSVIIITKSYNTLAYDTNTWLLVKMTKIQQKTPWALAMLLTVHVAGFNVLLQPLVTTPADQLATNLATPGTRDSQAPSTGARWRAPARWRHPPRTCCWRHALIKSATRQHPRAPRS